MEESGERSVGGDGREWLSSHGHEKRRDKLGIVRAYSRRTYYVNKSNYIKIAYL
jgi:hypothetical protein